MSYKGKKKRGERDHTSDGDSDAPIRKSLKNDSDDDSEIVICDISKNRRVSVKTWQRKTVVDIREYYVKDGKQLPGRKGISLSMDQWKEIRKHIEEIDDAFKEKLIK